MTVVNLGAQSSRWPSSGTQIAMRLSPSDPTLRDALARVRAATRQMHAAAAAAAGVGRFSPEEEHELRNDLRKGRRRHDDSAERLEKVAAEFEAKAVRLTARLGSSATMSSDFGVQKIADPGIPTVGEVPQTGVRQAEVDTAGAVGPAARASEEDLADHTRSSVDEDAAALPPRRRAKRVAHVELAEMTPQELERVGAIRAAIIALERGLPAERALAEQGLQGSKRWLLDMRRRFRTHGYAGLLDRRRANHRPAMFDGVRTLALALLFKFPLSPIKAVWHKFIAACRERGLPELSFTRIIGLPGSSARG